MRLQALGTLRRREAIPVGVELHTRAVPRSNAASSCAGSTSNWASSIVPSANSLAVVKWKSTRLNPSENSVWPSGSPARAITVTPMIPVFTANPMFASNAAKRNAYAAVHCARLPVQSRARPCESGTAVGNCVGSGAPNATAMSPVAGFTSTLVLTWNGNCNRSQIVWNRVITSHTPPGCASTP